MVIYIHHHAYLWVSLTLFYIYNTTFILLYFSEGKSGKPLTKLFLQTIFNNEKALFSWHTGFFLLYTYIYVASLFPHTFSFFSTLYFLLGTIYFFTILLLQVFHIFFISQECEINTALLRTCFHHFMECWTFNFGYKICVRRKMILSLHWKNILLVFSLLSQSSYKQWWTEPDRTYRIYRTGSVSGSVRSGSVFSSNTKPDFSNEMCP